MEKDALLEIIIHEVKEIERLLETFRGQPTLSPAFFKLARNKANNIVEEIDLLKQLANEIPAPSPQASTRQVPEEEIPAPPEPEAKTPPVKQELPQEADFTEPLSENPDPVSKEPEATPIPALEVPPPPSPETISEKEILGEALRKNNSSFNEIIGKQIPGNTTRRVLTAPPVSDLRKAIGINDRFLFQRELFGGNGDLLNQTLNQLNEMQSFEDASSFLTTNFNWASDNEAVSDFWDLVGRRFI